MLEYSSKHDCGSAMKRDVLLYLGIGAITAGCWLYSPAVGLVAFGVLLVGIVGLSFIPRR